MNLGVLVSGRGSNLQALLDASARGQIESRVVVVLSDVADAPALDRAARAGVPAEVVPCGKSRARIAPSSARHYVETLRRHHVELIVLAGFMRIIGPTFFRAFANRIINIHPSLLPSFRGLDAQRQALEAGVKVSGCTVHLVTEALDAGPIIAQAAVPVRDGDTAESLSERILVEEHRVLVEAIRLLEQGRIRIHDGRTFTVPPGASPEGVAS